jgi:hypothetical protein
MEIRLEFWDNYWDDFYWDQNWPIVLDLDGDGIEINPLSSSNTFFDTAGDGYQHRTAWAGAGDAVLAFDANNDGVINQKNEIVFTEWDPTAASDISAAQCLRHKPQRQARFGRPEFSQFKLVAANANREMKTRDAQESLDHNLHRARRDRGERQPRLNAMRAWRHRPEHGLVRLRRGEGLAVDRPDDLRIRA